MRRRASAAFRPDLERFEAKRLLNAGIPAVHVAHLGDGPGGQAAHRAETSKAGAAAGADARSGRPSTLPHQFLVFRITVPRTRLVHLVPPFQQVRVQHIQPVPGRVYNVLYVAVMNGTNQTFTAANNFKVRLPGFTGTHRVVDSAFPVLTGDHVWKPKTWIVFYALSKDYYPLSPQLAAGFQFNTGGRSSTVVPGPSGIFLRLTYNPATFARTLNWIVAYGQGAQLGPGAAVGLPDTAINELVAAQTHRMDFAGHF
jgi:hypothetical protein